MHDQPRQSNQNPLSRRTEITSPMYIENESGELEFNKEWVDNPGIMHALLPQGSGGKSLHALYAHMKARSHRSSTKTTNYEESDG